MPIWINPAINDVALEITYRVYQHHAERLGIGYYTNISKSTNVMALSSAYEGLAYRCWRAPVVADRTSGSFRTSGGPTALKYYYYPLGTDGRWVEWDVGTLVTPANSIKVYVVGVTTGDLCMEIVKNPATDNVVVGTINTYNGSTNYFLGTAALTLTETINTGDVLRFRRKAGSSASCSLVHWWLYNNVDPPTAVTDVWDIPTPVIVQPTGTTNEYAYSICPNGVGINKWTGGSAHQGYAGNCNEIDVVEQWNVGGVVWTPALGWTAGEVQLHRVANVDYDNTYSGGDIHRVIATTELLYEFGYRGTSCQHDFIPSEELDYASVYPCMSTVAPGFTRSVDNKWNVVDITLTDNESIQSESPTEVTDHWFLRTPLGCARHVHLDRCFDTTYQAFVQRRTAGDDKFYWSVQPTEYLTAGNHWFSKWSAEWTFQYPEKGVSQITLAPFKRMPVTQTVASTAPKLWVSADRGLFVADGAGAATLISREGRLKHFVQATESKQPTLDADGLGGKPALVFSAAAVQILTLVEDWLTGSDGYLFVVASVTANTQSKYMLFVGDTANLLHSCGMASSSAEKMVQLWQGGGDYKEMTGTTIQTALALFEFGSNSSTYSMMLNGVVETHTATHGTDTGHWFGDMPARTHVNLGGRLRTSEDAHFNGKIAEWLYYEPYPSAAVKTIARDYLLDKYGIA